MNKRSILKKTTQVGVLTLLSRVCGLVREYLLGRYLGAGIVSDAFFAAYKIPNSLRKIFAEGALTASFIPIIVNIMKNPSSKEGKKEASGLLSLAFIFFEGLLILLCFLMFINVNSVVSVAAPGFSLEKAAYTAELLKILISFVVFISSSALLAGALQSVNHFLTPALGPVLLNVVFITALGVCIYLNLPLNYLCYAILFGGLLNFILHLFVYFRFGFSFGHINKKAFQNLRKLLSKFFPIMFGMSIMEINLFIDTSFASYLVDGSFSIIRYAARFVGIPLGVFAVAFSTILLPHFSKVSSYAPKRLSFYLLESAKFIFWVTIPVSIIMAFSAEKIFYTLFLSNKFNLAKVLEARSVLIAFLVGLFFFSINKVLLNIYYSLQDIKIPTIIAIIATVINFGLNPLLMYFFQSVGLAMATTVSAIIQMFLLFYYLRKKYKFRLFKRHIFRFLFRYLAQLSIIMPLLFIVYKIIETIIINFLSMKVSNFLLLDIGYWAWSLPLYLLTFFLIYKTKNLFRLRIYFLEQ